MIEYIFSNTGPYHHIIFYAILFFFLSLIFHNDYKILFVLLVFYAILGEISEYIIVVFIEELKITFPVFVDNKFLNLFYFQFEYLDILWNIIGGGIGIFIVYIFRRFIKKDPYKETIYVKR